MRKELIISMALVVTGFMYCSKPADTPPQEPGPNPGGGGGGNPGTTLAITTVSPDRSENTTVTITGTGFNSTAANNTVFFGQLQATVQAASATQLVVNLPASIVAGDYTITVTTGGKTVTKINGFHFIDWVVSTWAGSTTGNDDGPIATARFRRPGCMTVDAAGNFYVSDLHVIRKITPQGIVSTYAGTGARGSANGPKAAATFNFLNGLVMDKAGNLYVADGFNHMVRKISAAGEVTTIAGSTTFGYKDDVGTAAAFSNPYGIVLDADEKNLLIGDHANHRIRKLNLATQMVTTLAGNGTQTSTDGKEHGAGIPWPGGLTWDADGSLYMTEKGAGKVRKMDAAGNVTTIGGFLSVNTSPVQMVTDDARNLYVVYKGMDKIKKYTPAGLESDFAGGNISGDLTGPAKNASFLRPEGIILVKDAQGKQTFYIADSDNAKIKKITRE